MVGALPLDLKQVKGGVEAVILNLFEGFRMMPDIRIIHIAFSKETREKKEIRFAENITVIFLPFRSRLELLDYSINRRQLNQIIREERPQLIHIQEITPQLLRFITFPKVNIVVTQHGIMAEELKYASGPAQKLKGLFKVGVEKFAFPIFKNIIFISTYNRKLFPGKPAHEALIFNPVNPKFFSTHAAGPIVKNAMLYVGVLSRRKNIRLVIEALHEMKKANHTFELHVAGGFKETAYEQEVMESVDQYGLKDLIRFHGWLKQDEILKLYESCPIFVLPSLQETLPVSIAEAMAQGKIVIASDVGAIHEMFTDGQSGFLFRPNDKNNLVQVLTAVFNRKAENNIGLRAREDAYDKFHPAKIAERTVQFYREVYRSGAIKKGGRPA